MKQPMPKQVPEKRSFRDRTRLSWGVHSLAKSLPCQLPWSATENLRFDTPRFHYGLGAFHLFRFLLVFRIIGWLLDICLCSLDVLLDFLCFGLFGLRLHVLGRNYIFGFHFF